MCGLGGMQTAQKLGTEAMPTLWWLSENRPSQRPWPEVTQIPSHTWGERGGWPGVTQHFICSSIWGGLGSSTPQPGPELMNLSGTAVCFSHKWGWEVVSWMRRAYYSLKQVL